LFAVCASSYFDQSVLSVVLDPIKQEFHVSDTMLGLLSGFCFSLVYALSGLPIARWADRGNRLTVITCALTCWSIATALCGVSHSFWQLALARFGLGVAEPGALPPAQSLAADYFPAEQRATAVAILTQGGSAVGWLAGVALGGYLAAIYGWRAAFVFAGVSGLLVALLVKLCLSEPRTHRGFMQAPEVTESLGQVFARLRAKRSFVLLIIGMSTYSVFSFGVTTFLPSFMMRSLNASLAQASVTWGIAIALANLFGAVAGGWFGDRLSRSDVRWYAWLPALACALTLPLYAFSLCAHNLSAFIERDFVAELILSMGVSPIFAAAHVVCGSQRRATAIAVLFLFITLIGSGFGPLIAGWLSDVFSSKFGIESLRYSLMAMLLFLIPAGVAFYSTSHAMFKDAED
jgi:predicted MFS family arabinose efflux permease